jgi:hypothetical protein
LQPVLTWWLAARVFALPLTLVQMAVVLAALPTGTGPFMLAEFYQREAHITSRTILLSTLGSLVSLSLLLFIYRTTAKGLSPIPRSAFSASPVETTIAATGTKSPFRKFFILVNSNLKPE